MKTSTGLVEYAKTKLGLPYWYGTFGQIGTEALLSQKAKQYPQHYGKNRLGKYKSQIGKQVFDCIGLVKAYVWSDADGNNIRYNPNQDWSADMSQARCKEKGPISTIPEIPGVLVFSPGHVGIYIGGGEVIEAKGFAFGVVKTKLKAGTWRSWGKIPWINYVEVDDLGDPIKVIVEGKSLEGFVTKEGKSFVELRAMADEFKAKVAWNQEEKIATVIK